MSMSKSFSHIYFKSNTSLVWICTIEILTSYSAPTMRARPEFFPTVLSLGAWRGHWTGAPWFPLPRYTADSVPMRGGTGTVPDCTSRSDHSTAHSGYLCWIKCQHKCMVYTVGYSTAGCLWTAYFYRLAKDVYIIIFMTLWYQYKLNSALSI